ncbi:peptide/nickel transport system substrate-binding protein [Deinococcus sp. HSC-46F16]|uniref:ABC transporter substrate-binding protein n=1 Tax=Deinococcus sp. HSC-46F16 TaxID=2910968 RepID=UPI00209DE302|nr:ABC transporter substrate-binding protein [Deinococcus sp. HSC-46F16]MCP2015792.1 peptide/nickel transport system substrate-binding protein [Deinococcus sp. HSC-46F16]
MKTQRTFALIPALSLALLAGCVRTQPTADARDFAAPAAWTVNVPQQVQRGGVLRVAEVSDTLTLNPFVNASSGGLLAWLGAPGGLLIQNPVDGGFLPFMAQSSTRSADGRTWDFVLRPDLAWSDGQPIRPEDFVSTAQLHADPAVESNSYDSLRGVTVTKTGERSLRVVFAEARASAEATLAFGVWPDHVFGAAYRAGGAAAVRALWPRTLAAADVVTAGPFRPTTLNADGSSTLERNPHYGAWVVDHTGQPLPYLDGIEVRRFASTDAAFEAFRQGELDLLPASPTPAQLETLRGTPGTDLRENYSPAASSSWIVWNFNRASDPEKQRLFRETAFRQAMSHLVDRERIVREVYGGAAEPAYSNVYAVFREWLAPDLPRFDFNPQEARRLLATLGYGTLNSAGNLTNAQGRVLEFDLITNEGNPQREAMARIFVEGARQAGVEVNFRAVPFNDLVTRLSSSGPDRPFDAILLGLSGGSSVWPFGPNVVPCSGNLHAYNRSGACLFDWERQMTDLYVQGDREPDRTRRIAIGRELQATEAQHQPFVYLVSPRVSTAWRDRVEGEYPATLASSHYGPRWLSLTWLRR